MAAPCDWEIDTSCCQTFWGTLTPEVQATATSYATMALWARTGRQYGACPVTVRPCGRWCNDAGVAGYFWSAGTWLPYVLDGQWYNCACGMGLGCLCEPACQIYLPGPVAGVSEVRLDGVVVDPATYRVDDRRWLVRTGVGNCWPMGQDYNVDSGPGTLFVDYTRGTALPSVLASAAGTLACEYAKACVGLECRLPAYITGLSRQGVDFTAVDPMFLLDRGFTGLWEVDGLIRDLNPGGLTHRPRLLSPDIAYPRITTTP